MKQQIGLSILVSVLLMLTQVILGCHSSKDWTSVPVKLPPEFPLIVLGETEDELLKQLETVRKIGYRVSKFAESSSRSYEEYEVKKNRHLYASSIEVIFNFSLIEDHLSIVSSRYVIDRTISREDSAIIGDILNVGLDTICGRSLYPIRIAENSIYIESIMCDIRTLYLNKNSISHLIDYAWITESD
jgi:hypothetical protein